MKANVFLVIMSSDLDEDDDDDNDDDAGSGSEGRRQMGTMQQSWDGTLLPRVDPGTWANVHAESRD